MFAAESPYRFGGPATGPGESFRRPVAAGCVGFGNGFNQILNSEVIRTEQPDPLAVWQLEYGFLPVVDRVQTEVVEYKPVTDLVGVGRPADGLELASDG